MDVQDVAKQLSLLISKYSSVLVGRETELRVFILSLVTKHHMYMLSPPGTGKTLTEIVAKSTGMSFYYYLFSYDTKLEDIVYDPVITEESVGRGKKLIIEYELKQPGLGTSEIFFADEMFKASTPVLNALLGAMNERRLTLGSRTYKIPLWTLVAASNELPESEALVDRFLWRVFMDYLPKERWAEYLLQYWNIHQPGFNRYVYTVPRDVIVRAHELMWKVDVFSVLDLYLRTLSDLYDNNIILSDRRKGRILQAVAANAVLNGRLAAEPEDLIVLLYTAPKNEDELETVKKVVDKALGGLLRMQEELRSIENQLKSLAAKKPASLREVVDIAEKLYTAIPRLEQFEAVPSLHRRLEKIRETIATIEDRLAEEAAKMIVGEIRA